MDIADNIGNDKHNYKDDIRNYMTLKTTDEFVEVESIDRVSDKIVEIEVDGHKVKESQSERLLGVLINNTMTWENHLYGNSEYKGLIPKLSQRANYIWKLSSVMPRERLNILAEGIFFSLLNYCIEVYGNVWGLPTYDDQARQSPALRKEDLLKLQILTNKVLRSLTSLPRDTPVSVLIAKSGSFLYTSVQLFTLQPLFTSP